MLNKNQIIEEMKRFLKIVCVVVLLSLFTITASAHSGRTDSNGGHYDSSTGKYHYHHGYSAHQHYDMDGDGINDCPYEFEDKTNHNNAPSNSTPQLNNAPLSFGEVLIIMLKIIGHSLEYSLMGLIVWVLVYAGLKPLLIWICKKIFKIDANTSILNIISIAIIATGVTIIASLVVLRSEGLL